MSKPLAAFLIFASVAFVTGCQTVESRISQKPQVFASLDAATQQKIKQGVVEQGFTTDMVYLALGKSGKRYELVDEQGKYMSWVYHTDEVTSSQGREVSSWDEPSSLSRPGSAISEGRFVDGRFTGNRGADYELAQGSFAEREFAYQSDFRFRKNVREIVFTDGKVDVKREGSIAKSWRKLVEKHTAELKARYPR